MLHVQSVLQYRPIFAASPRPRKALFTPILQLPRSLAGRRLFGFRFGNFCCVINSSRTEGETPKEGRRTPPQKSDNLQAARGGGGGWCGLPELPFFRRPFPGADAEIFPHGDILLECSSFEAADARRARALPVPQLPLSAPPPSLHSVLVRPQCLPTATDRRSPSRTSVSLPTTNDFPIQKTPVIPRGSIKRKSCPRAGDIFAPSPGEGAGCRSV